MDTGSLSAEFETMIAQIRSQVEDLVAQVARLQSAWNHPPEVTEIIDKVSSSLETVDANLGTL